MSGATGLRFTFSSHDNIIGGNGNVFDAPLFERIGNSEELTQCRLTISDLQHRVNDLERINLEIEHRLEEQAKQCMAVEKECTDLERKWKDNCAQLGNEIESWKAAYAAQKLKSDKLREHLSRTERELYSILQRKYELMRNPGRGSGGGGGGGGGGSGMYGNNSSERLRNMAPNHEGSAQRRGSGTEGGGGGRSLSNLSLVNQAEEIFSTKGIKAPQEIRQRRMLASLTDFLGL